MNGNEQGTVFALLIFVVVLLAHQYVLHQAIIEWHDINNHETVALGLLMLAVGIFIGDKWK